MQNERLTQTIMSEEKHVSPAVLKERARKREQFLREQKKQILSHMPEGTLFKCDHAHDESTTCIDINCYLGDNNPLVRKTKEIKEKEQNNDQ